MANSTAVSNPFSFSAHVEYGIHHAVCPTKHHTTLNPHHTSLYLSHHITPTSIRINMSLSKLEANFRLMDLPVELLLKVCGFFCWHCRGLCYLDLIKIKREQDMIKREQEVIRLEEIDRDKSGPDGAESANADSHPPTTDPASPQCDEVASLLRGKSSLISLSRTYRSLRNLVQPLIYHTLFFSDALCTPYRLLNIIALFKNRPDLSSSVFELYHDDHPYSMRHHELNLQLISRMKQGPLLASFLQVASNLRHAHIRMPQESYQGLLRALDYDYSASTSLARPLSSLKLKHLAIEGHHSHAEWGGIRFVGVAQPVEWVGPLLKPAAPTSRL